MPHRNIKYSTTVPLVSSSITLHKTFMDTVGRTMLTLHAINIVDDFRDRELIVTYDYPFIAILRKPLVIFCAAFAVFITAWGIGSLDVGIKGRK
jgi:oligosaccharyltransferase complex subunit alpha (ribophorin I)